MSEAKTFWVIEGAGTFWTGFPNGQFSDDEKQAVRFFGQEDAERLLHWSLPVQYRETCRSAERVVTEGENSKALGTDGEALNASMTEHRATQEELRVTKLENERLSAQLGRISESVRDRVDELVAREERLNRQLVDACRERDEAIEEREVPTEVLVNFLYLLIRDHVVTGRIEDVIKNLGAARPRGVGQFPLMHLGEYCQDLAEGLCDRSRQ